MDKIMILSYIECFIFNIPYKSMKVKLKKRLIFWILVLLDSQ